MSLRQKIRCLRGRHAPHLISEHGANLSLSRFGEDCVDCGKRLRRWPWKPTAEFMRDLETGAALVSLTSEIGARAENYVKCV